MPVGSSYRPSTAHAGLGGDVFDEVAPAAFPEHILRHRNQRWAARVGLGTLTDAEWIDHFGRFTPLPGNLPKPLALRYHGHQFRVYNPELGDGRGFLFAQAYDDTDRLLDLGTKGSGQTPWSRQGDGRLTLKGGVREVLATAMLEALGVDTSKSFSLIETGEQLARGDEPSPTRSSVLVRLSHSHIRIGTFQRLLYLDQPASLLKLMDYTIETYMPGIWRDSAPERAVAFLGEVCRRVARTGAQWMVAGFVHGVLNTDNINVTGESFDYGPWRFLPVLDPQFTAAYFDETRLYAFGRQPSALAWNVTRLAECLLPLAGQKDLEQALTVFEPTLHEAFVEEFLRRLGLRSVGTVKNAALAFAFWSALGKTRAPFEQAFFDWRGGLLSAERIAASPSAAHYASPAFDEARALLPEFEPAAPDVLAHPYFSGRTPCTMLIDEMEALWAPVAERDDWSAFEDKLAGIEQMRTAYAGMDRQQA